MQDIRQSDDPAITKAWEITMSQPPQSPQTWRRNKKNLTVMAGTAEDALKLVRETYPDATIWSLLHRGERTLRGNIFEHKWH